MNSETSDNSDLTARFQAARPRLGALAYRMLGSIDDAEDAVQEAWLRLSRSTESTDGAGIANVDAWLTTVVARICLNTLRDRGNPHREEPVARVPDPVVEADGEFDPEHRALLADAVGLALFVVLDTLPPAERLALVLHDVFAVPFDQIAPIVERSPEATRKLASRARHRVRQADPVPDAALAAQREAVDAFFAAGRSGDFGRLCRCCTRMSCCAATSDPERGTAPRARRRLPSWPAATRDPSARCAPPPLTAPPARSSSWPAGRRRSWDSWCATAWSPRSTCWPTRRGSPGSIWAR